MFDPKQDIKDEPCCKNPNYGIEDFNRDRDNQQSFMFATVNLGDGGRIGLYIMELYENCEVVKEWEKSILVKFKTKKDREIALLKIMEEDLMLKKKLDRFYLVDDCVAWNQKVFMDIAKRLNLLDENKERMIRLSGSPRHLERDCIIQMEDTMKLMNIKPPLFGPKDYSHALFCVEFVFDDQKYVGYSLEKKELFYAKAPDKTGEWDKESRAYFKLYEAVKRFKIELKDGMKAIDVGASPGGWTQYLVEQGCKVYSVDPAPLTLKEELKNRYVWLNGLSTNKDVINRLKEDGPFDLIVSDMNQYPDELGRSFDEMIPLLKVGGMMIITIKLAHLRPEQRFARKFSKGSQRFVTHFEEKFPLKMVGLKWLLQNKNERTSYWIKH